MDKRLGPFGGPPVPRQRVQRYEVHVAAKRVVFPRVCSWCGSAPGTTHLLVQAPLASRRTASGHGVVVQAMVEAPCCAVCDEYQRKRALLRGGAILAGGLAILSGLAAGMIVLVLVVRNVALLLAGEPPEILPGAAPAQLLVIPAVAALMWWVRGRLVAPLRAHPAPAEPVLEMATAESFHVFDAAYARELAALNGAGEPRAASVARLPTTMSGSRYRRLVRLNPPQDRPGTVVLG